LRNAPREATRGRRWRAFINLPLYPYADGTLGTGIFVFDTLSPLEFPSDSVFFYNGKIDKFLGHGLMAVFGPPRPGPVDATSAARCALHILQSVERWNDRCQRSGEAKIRIEVGIHYGEVIQGDIGSDKLLELTVVGDTVYIASA
jgi:class 3 adenylate cyclase